MRVAAVETDGDRVPVPHTGLAMTVDQFHMFADRLRKHGVTFMIEPHLRFKVGALFAKRQPTLHGLPTRGADGLF